jgi:hypothetical protein
MATRYGTSNVTIRQCPDLFPRLLDPLQLVQASPAASLPKISQLSASTLVSFDAMSSSVLIYCENRYFMVICFDR